MTGSGYRRWSPGPAILSPMRVIIDGRSVDPQEASVSIFDWGLLRGDGIFEVIRSYGGNPFAVGAHLDRLLRSARMLHLELPDRESIAHWVRRVAADGGDCVVRVVVTRGGYDHEVTAPSRVLVMWETVPEFPDALAVRPTAAPWHSGGIPWELMGAKTLSYAPNMSAWRVAREEGFDDALLIDRDGHVLEGPTFTIGWVTGGAVETPSLDLGILASITRKVVVEEARRLGLEVREGRFYLDRVLGAEEVFALSTVKEVKPVGLVGDTSFDPGPITKDLSAAFTIRVGTELA